MNSITRAVRSVSGSIVTVTSREDAQQRAIERLDNNPDHLIAEIERDIERQVGRMHVSARGGNYTPEVLTAVASLYQSRGWNVRFTGYWLTLE